MKRKSSHCDIFCAVVDNYGDIGVSWRLARQLAHEYGVAVRLWVDDLESFGKLCPQLDATQAQQDCQGIEIRHWVAAFPDTEPADLVIEAFACGLPDRYVAAMAAQTRKPVWINLEHLSAEQWVAGCHGLPSPHPSWPLTKYFFFPGFTPDTGGLLLERGLFEQRERFQNDPAAIAAFWHALGIVPPDAMEIRVSLFCYQNPALPALFSAWCAGNLPILCLVPEGPVQLQVAQFFGQAQVGVGQVFKRGNLQVRVLPFMDQQRYDELLWACDINFVRGEDSCVRAQWAGRPLVWHIYQQQDKVHIQKLHALIERYCVGLSMEGANAVHQFWGWWNNDPNAAKADATQIWNDFLAQGSMLRQHTQAWAQQLSGNTLALNLLDFYQKIDRMPATSDSKQDFKADRHENSSRTPRR